jgi:hypothetical protein
MSLAGKIRTTVVGLLRALYGIRREGQATYAIAPANSEVRIGTVTTGDYLSVGSAAVTLGSAISQVRKEGFANFSVANATVTLGGAAAAATTSTPLIVKKTGIADNTATDVITVTVPNANHAAAIRLTIVSSNGSTDAFESTRVAVGMVVLARTTGANAVATAVALTNAGIATVAAGATHLLAYGVSAISGAVGAANTFTIQVTIDDSGNLGSNQAVVLAELVNAESSGVTLAAA